MESLVWLLALLIYGIIVLFPRGMIYFLGRGRVIPSPNALLFLRIAAAVCFVGTIYRLITLNRR